MKFATMAVLTSTAALMLSGCATVTEGKSDPLAITTVPVDGAKCTLKNGVGTWYLTTPGSVEIHKSKTDLEITCTKPGYQDAHVTLESHLEGWTFGNLILGGVIGIGVDAASGAMNHYQKALQITLYPVGTAPVPVPTASPTS
jgi:hypothetical protein